MTTVHANKLIIAVQVVIACAVTLFVLELTKYFAGREAMWILGLAFLLLAGFALFRLSKKV